MQQTTNYNFNKPEMSDAANIQTAVSDNMDAIDAALHAHEADTANPHGVTAAQAGAIPGVECEKYMYRIYGTPNLISDPLQISQAAGAANDLNRSFRFSYGSGEERSANYPTELQTGTIMGVREVQWTSASQVVVKLTEWYPVLGRTWYNRWTGSAWLGWRQAGARTLLWSGSAGAGAVMTAPGASLYTVFAAINYLSQTMLLVRYGEKILGSTAAPVYVSADNRKIRAASCVLNADGDRLTVSDANVYELTSGNATFSATTSTNIVRLYGLG